RVDVVHTGRTEVGALGAGDHGQVRGRGAEPLLRVLGGHGDRHQVADLLAGEEQVLLDLVFRQAQVRELVVAHGIGAVAVQTVVDEQFGAVLQGRKVGDAIGGAVQVRAAFG